MLKTYLYLVDEPNKGIIALAKIQKQSKANVAVFFTNPSLAVVEIDREIITQAIRNCFSKTNSKKTQVFIYPLATLSTNAQLWFKIHLQ